MVRYRYYQRGLFEALLPDADKLWPDPLRRIDSVLEDDGVIETIAEALEKRWRLRPVGPAGNARGRGAADAHPQTSLSMEL